MADFSFCTTPYLGFEDEVLRIRNRNRSVSQTRAYLDWRYLGQEAQSPPEIFWVKASSTGSFIGMAALIYRPYWLGCKKYDLGVFGDISLDREYRGTGLADKFFLFIRQQLRQKTSPCIFVIPNIAAEKVLGRCGWLEYDRFVHHVLLLRPRAKIHEMVKIKSVSVILTFLYLFFLKMKLRGIETDGLTINTVSEFNEEFTDFLEAFPRESLCIRDKSRRSLQWRYRDHPDGDSYSIVTFRKGGVLIGYLIYSVNGGRTTLTVYDLMVMETKYLRGCIKLFIGFVNENIQVDSIRIALNATHPYCGFLKKIGFSARKGGQAIQILVPGHAGASVKEYQWALTTGDKDV